mmetsp:Transcript_101087/g.185165  ORF Transcript_101087/g.185165 Transcript_101087/m.185165 type:complete len:321 (-) Transcript_101087:673-1635(-)
MLLGQRRTATPRRACEIVGRTVLVLGGLLVAAVAIMARGGGWSASERPDAVGTVADPDPFGPTPGAPCCAATMRTGGGGAAPGPVQRGSEGHWSVAPGLAGACAGPYGADACRLTIACFGDVATDDWDVCGKLRKDLAGGTAAICCGSWISAISRSSSGVNARGTEMQISTGFSGDFDRLPLLPDFDGVRITADPVAYPDEGCCPLVSSCPSRPASGMPPTRAAWEPLRLPPSLFMPCPAGGNDDVLGPRCFGWKTPLCWPRDGIPVSPLRCRTGPIAPTMLLALACLLGEPGNSELALGAAPRADAMLREDASVATLSA